MIWDVKPVEKKPFWIYLANRLFSIGMIACIAFLLLVSLVINVGLAALSEIIGQHFQSLSKLLIGILEFTISFGLTTVLFAFIYKFMSDIKMPWKNVWYGAIFTSLLFAVGKYVISIYISKSNIAGTYGAASSVIIVLLWVYYSSQIVFFGAEFTRVLAEERGIHIDGIDPPPPPKP
jgi:membrane protein